MVPGCPLNLRMLLRHWNSICAPGQRRTILPETTTVAADEWVSQHRYLRDSGLRFFDLLVAVDLGDQVTEVDSCHVR